MPELQSVEICAGGGGQALGLEHAGFGHAALVEIDRKACETLRYNRPAWNVLEGDLAAFNGKPFLGIDLLAGGVPCPPFSVAGKQLGRADERDLFPEVIRLAREMAPKAVMIENVRGLMSAKFDGYRRLILNELESLGFEGEWKLLNASDFGVPQLRPRAVLVALKAEFAPYFSWPQSMATPLMVGEALLPYMAADGWKQAGEWSAQAMDIAPTLVGGSKKHGGPDLGPTRARKAWERLGVDGRGLADAPPGPDFEGMPRLTVQMAAIVQGFPPEWTFTGGKTHAYRQVGNAFPPPVAAAVGRSIAGALRKLKPTLWRREKVLELDFGNS